MHSSNRNMHSSNRNTHSCKVGGVETPVHFCNVTVPPVKLSQQLQQNLAALHLQLGQCLCQTRPFDTQLSQPLLRLAVTAILFVPDASAAISPTPCRPSQEEKKLRSMQRSSRCSSFPNARPSHSYSMLSVDYHHGSQGENMIG